MTTFDLKKYERFGASYNVSGKQGNMVKYLKEIKEKLENKNWKS